MPIYVYKCQKCGCTDEVYRSISERENRHLCINCDVEMTLIIRAPAFKMGRINMADRLNQNYAKRQERKAKGEFVGDKGSL